MYISYVPNLSPQEWYTWGEITSLGHWHSTPPHWRCT